MLRENHQFYDFVVKYWFKKLLVDDVLKLCHSESSLKQFTQRYKISLVYQCASISEFENLQQATAVQANWRAITADRRNIPIQLTTQMKLAVDLVRDLFSKSAIFSIPAALFDRAIADMGEVDSTNAANAVMHLFDQPSLEFQLDACDDLVFFEVLNQWSGSRRLVPIAHVDAHPNQIVVSKRRQNFQEV